MRTRILRWIVCHILTTIFLRNNIVKAPVPSCTHSAHSITYITHMDYVRTVWVYAKKIEHGSVNHTTVIHTIHCSCYGNKIPTTCLVHQPTNSPWSN